MSDVIEDLENLAKEMETPPPPVVPVLKIESIDTSKWVINDLQGAPKMTSVPLEREDLLKLTRLAVREGACGPRVD